jgi:hypothetical protein
MQIKNLELSDKTKALKLAFNENELTSFKSQLSSPLML